MSDRTRGPVVLPCLLAAGLVVLAGGTACGDHEFQPPKEEERVAEAESLYAAAGFDTVAWPSDSVRLRRGNELYAVHCRRCHGYLGRGDGDYARARGLDVPSLVSPDWEYGNDRGGLVKAIFVGHGREMPTWGVAAMTPREIDATAFYVLEELRPDVLGSEEGP